MSEKAHFLTHQAMFWFKRGDSVNGGRRSFWEDKCRELAAELIGAGCAAIAKAGGAQ